MLDSVSEDVRRYCYRHAEECARRAACQSNARVRQDFLELERRWLDLAQNSEVAEPLDRLPESEDIADANDRSQDN
jgi:hypothetical protein